MKLLMISPMYPSERDPVYGTFVKTYMDFFLQNYNNDKPKLVCIKGHGNTLLSKIVKYGVFYLKIIFTLLFYDFDIIYVHTITTTIPPIRFVSIFKHLNVVYNVHGGDVVTTHKATERFQKIAKPFICMARLIVVPSEYFKKVFKDVFPEIAEEQLFVSPSGGVDLIRFKPYGTIEKKELVLGFVSSIYYGKGWDMFVRLIAQLKNKGIKVKGIMAGRGVEKASLFQLIEKEDVNDEVEYIGPVSHNNLPQLFNSFDVFVFPTKMNESLGLVGVESLACGIPVVGSNIASLPSYIREGINGYLFEPANQEDLFAKVMKYINLSSEEKKKMSLRARKSAEVFDSNYVMKMLTNRIDEIEI